MSPLAKGIRAAEVLLVEDNEGDVLLTREGLKRIDHPIRLSHVNNGEECLAFLKKEGQYGDAPTPDLIFLDLNMPVMGGQEVMEGILADERFRSIPVVVLTTADDPQMILDLYRLRCSTYVIKPVCFQEFQRIIKAIGEYWFTVASLPGELR